MSLEGFVEVKQLGGYKQDGGFALESIKDLVVPIGLHFVDKKMSSKSLDSIRSETNKEMKKQSKKEKNSIELSVISDEIQNRLLSLVSDTTSFVEDKVEKVSSKITSNNKSKTSKNKKEKKTKTMKKQKTLKTKNNKKRNKTRRNIRL